MTDAVLLPAAGFSSRMQGRDKLLEPVDGQPLLRRQTSRARAVCDRVFVALPPRLHPRYGAIEGLDVAALAIPESGEGLSGTLRGAVARLPADIDHLVLLLPDLPEITGADILELLGAAKAHPEALVWRGATSDGKPGHPVVFDRILFPEFARLSGDGGGGPIIRAAGDRVHLHPLKGDRARLDLDTPEAWAEWRSREKSSDDQSP